MHNTALSTPFLWWRVRLRRSRQLRGTRRRNKMRLDARRKRLVPESTAPLERDPKLVASFARGENIRAEAAERIAAATSSP